MVQGSGGEGSSPSIALGGTPPSPSQPTSRWQEVPVLSLPFKNYMALGEPAFPPL